MAKRICVVTSDVPFVEGGHLVIARHLTYQLNKHGYRAELILTPQNPFGKQFGAYVANALTVLSEDGDGNPIDGVVSFRFPSFAVKHPRHSCWLNHRMREYYDLWPIFKGRLSWKGRIKESVRRFIIHRLDEFCLDHRVKKLYAQSQTIKARLSMWGGHASEVLYPPAIERPYRNEGYENCIFAVSRLADHKRLDLLVRAAAAADVRCRIAGDGPDRKMLHDLVKDLGAEKLVTFLGQVDEEGLLQEYARCRAVAFPAFNEDYGLVTLEAFSSGKAVITCTDSGGPAELVENQITGLVADSDPQSLGAALRRLIDDCNEAEKMGAAALAKAKEFTWSAAVEKLVEW